MPLIRSFLLPGLERDSGLYAGTQAHAALLKQMLLAARQTVALVDGSKLGEQASRVSADWASWTVW